MTVSLALRIALMMFPATGLAAQLPENPADLDDRFSGDGKTTVAFDVPGTALSDIALAIVPRDDGSVAIVGLVGVRKTRGAPR